MSFGYFSQKGKAGWKLNQFLASFALIVSFTFMPELKRKHGGGLCYQVEDDQK